MKQLYSLPLMALLLLGASTTQADAQNVPPCTFAIDSQEAFDLWTPIDVNKDGGDNMWKYSESNHGALYVQNKQLAANDWLISPPVELTAGTTYKVTALVQNLTTFGSDKQKIAICYGTEAQPDALESNQIAKNESLAKTSEPVEIGGNFTAAESGEYYLGAHLYSSSFMGDCLVTKIQVEVVAPHPGAVTDLTITPAENGALSATLNWKWPVKSDMDGTLESITGARIYRATSSYSLSETDTYLVGTLDQEATPGAEGEWTDNTIENPGKYYYMVVPFNADGASTASASHVQSPWIGNDTPKNVTNVVALADETNPKKVLLSFDYPLGQNGGYVDLDNLNFKITRTALGSSAETLEESWHGELPYVDETIPGLNSYTYEVINVYNGSTSWSGTKSEALVTGGTMALPYDNTFDGTNSIALWTMINDGAGTRNWGISSSQLNYWGAGSPVDAYAVTPPFSLESGKAYNISFGTHVSSFKSPKPLYIMIGREPLANSLTKELYYEMIESSINSNKEVMFNVEEDGDYYIAFRVYGEISGTDDIYVDNLKIEEVVAAPLAPENLLAKALPDGESGVKLTWKNPGSTNAGTPLDEISKMEIRRNNTLIETLENLTPDQEKEFTDNSIEEPGVYEYSLTPYLGEEAGAVATVSSDWVGMDTPKAPASVTVTLLESGERSVAFEPVTESVHGGYVNFDAMTYTVLRNEDTLAENITSSPYTDSENDLELGSYTYGVIAKAGENESEAAYSSPVIFGESLALPYQPDFSDKATFDLWTFTNPSDETKNWKFNATKGACISSDYTGAWAVTPPFKAERGDCSVTYKATCYNSRYTEDLEIYLISDLSKLDEAVKIADYNVTSVSWPSDRTTEFPVLEDGTYHIGYKLVTQSPWTCYLYESNIAQTHVGVPTGVEEILSDNEAIVYNKAVNELIVRSKGELSIFSADGIEILHLSETPEKVSVKDLENATYLVMFISNDGKRSSLKFRK